MNFSISRISLTGSVLVQFFHALDADFFACRRRRYTRPLEIGIFTDRGRRVIMASQKGALAAFDRALVAERADIHTK